MKRFVVLMMVVATLLTFSVQALAADLEFVPSIEDKGAPDVVVKEDESGNIIVGEIVDANGNKLSSEKEECIIITPVRLVESSNELTEAEKKEMLAVYKELKEKGTSALPALEKKDLVIRDLFKISSDCNDIKEFLPVEGNTLSMQFKLNLGAKDHIEAVIYVDGAWSKVPVVNNGDGTVTVKFDKFGIVAFLTETAGTSPDTGDSSNADMALWISLMGVSAALLVVLTVASRRKNAEK